MKRKTRSINVLYQFALTYFAAILIAAGIITAVLVCTAANSISALEISAMKSALSMFANDMQAQHEAFERAYKRVLTSSQYHPAILHQSKFKDIELLEDIPNIANFSPISDHAFILYDGERMIYHSGGKKADFALFSAANYGLSHEKAEALYNTIAQIDGFKLLDLSITGENDYLLFLYSFRFPGAGVKTEAVIGFATKKADLAARLESVSGYPFENYAVALGGDCFLSKGMSIDIGALPTARVGETVFQKGNSGQYAITARTENGIFTVCATGSLNAFPGAARANRRQIALFVPGAVLLFLLFAFLFAERSSKPLRHLAARYGQPGAERTYNEFFRLENAILSLKKECDASVSTARQQLLLMIMHGNCNVEILKRWVDFGITLDHGYYCAFVIDLKGWRQARKDIMNIEIEGLSDEEMRLYSIPESESEHIAVLTGFRFPHLRREIIDNLSALVDERDAEQRVFGGETYDTPLKLATSYGEALAAYNATGDMLTDKGYEKADVLVEETQLAIMSGDMACAQARLKALAALTAQSEAPTRFQKYLSHRLLAHLTRYARENGFAVSPRRVSEMLLLQDFNVFSSDFLALVRDALNPREDATPAATRAILDYIDKNVYDCDFSLDTLADNFSLSADYISRLVKSATGVPFKEYIISLRMTYAQKLLIQHPEWTVNDVSISSGYRTPSNFIKKFRETTGITPVQYRRTPTPPSV